MHPRIGASPRGKQTAHPSTRRFARQPSERARYTEAERALRDALEIRERVLDSNAPLLFSARARLGECLLRLGRIEEAEPLIEAAVPALIAHFGETNAFTRHSIGIRDELRRLQATAAAKAIEDPK